MSVAIGGNQLNQILQSLSLQRAQFESLSQDPAGALRSLASAFSSLVPEVTLSTWQANMSAPGAFPTPSEFLPLAFQLCGGGYSGTVDSTQSTSDNWFSRLFSSNGEEGSLFERLLSGNPLVRSAFESEVGGRVLFDGRTDGRLTIESFFQGSAPIPGLAGNVLANNVTSLVNSMDAVIQQQTEYIAQLEASQGASSSSSSSAMVGAGGSNAPAFFASAFSQILGQLGVQGFDGLQGGGQGSLNPLAWPGLINNNTRGEEYNHQAQVTSVLNDPALTVEDRVMLMLMLICKKMDKDIQNQSEYINRIQQQQSNTSQKATQAGKAGSIAGMQAGGPTGAKIGQSVANKLATGSQQQGHSGAPSIDIETKKLERMIQKRTQMFDMLKAIMEKYDATAKNVIQSLGR